MDRDVDRVRNLNRRTVALGGLKLGLFGLLGARLYYLQVIEQDRLSMLAEDNRVNLRLISPNRGLIIDRSGEPLAVNELNYRLLLTPEEVDDVDGVLDGLRDVVPLTDEERTDLIEKAKVRRPFVPIQVTEDLTWEQVAWIEVHAPDLRGLSIEAGDRRRYPNGEVGVHVIGYVGAVSAKEVNDDPVLALPGFKIGKTGVERSREPELRGTAGTRRVEVNAYGRVVRELGRREGRQGQNVQVTLDIGLQSYVQNRLVEHNSASAVVMDIYKGDIFALASQPGYDPNLFPSGMPKVVWDRISTNPFTPLNNKAIGGEYAPGSTFKMIVALAALAEGVIDQDFEARCTGAIDLGNQRFHCWRRGGHGRVSLIKALAQSCDVYFYEICQLIGIDKIAETAARFGLGVDPEFDLSGASAGLVPNKAWKERAIRESWHIGDTLNAAIGQGDVLSTPLQLALMTARLVNGGLAVKPRAIRNVGNRLSEPDETLPPTLGYSQTHLAIIRDGMVEVVSGRNGTAQASQIVEDGLAMGGKTGTSQVLRITSAERASGVTSNDDRVWEARDHALFVGFAPVRQPRYACAVLVEHGGSGGSVAAPIARDILYETQVRAPAIYLETPVYVKGLGNAPRLPPTRPEDL